MKILVLGGSGFIGRRLVAWLRAQGYGVAAPGRRELDFLRPSQAAALACLQGQDVVVNAVGVMSRHADVLETVHHHTPRRLAQWARQAGVRHWVQLSALGADARQMVAFVGSKGRGDAAVMESGLSVALARPSVVYGRGGVSCELFIRLARLPWLPLPGGGRFDLQPVHVAEVAEGLAALALGTPPHGTVVNMVGARALTLADYLSVLRQTVHGQAPLKVWPLPLGLIRPLLPLGKVLTNGILSPDSMALLEQGACADSAGFAALLGRAPLAAAAFADVD